jgi:glyoxylate reductase
MAKAKVVVSRKPPGPALSKLFDQCDTWMWEEDRACPRELLLEKVKTAEGLYTMIPDQINAELLAAAPKLRVVSTMAVGVDNLDVKALTARGIPLGYTPGVVTEATADLAFALILALSRRIVDAANLVRAGEWKVWSPTLMISNDVFGKTLGIFGMGRIGQSIAKRARGFDMPVLYHNRNRSPEAEKAVGAQYRSFDDLLAQSDIVCVNAPMTPETKQKFNKAAFSKMKRDAFFVNVARGGLVHHPDLNDALNEGLIKAAALDVTDPEPIPLDSPLRTNPKCLIIPHVGTCTWETRGRMTQISVDNLLLGLEGKPMLHCVNAEQLRK